MKRILSCNLYVNIRIKKKGCVKLIKMSKFIKFLNSYNIINLLYF